MKLTLITVADHAYVDNATHKVYILGIYTTIHTFNKFPVSFEGVTLVAKVCPEITDHSDYHDLKIELLDEEAGSHFHLSSKFKSRPLTQTGNVETNIIVNIDQIIFPNPGSYEFVLSVDEVILGRTPFEVISQSADSLPG